MGTSYNPKIVTDGLVLNLDPANVKSYPANQDPFVNNVSLMLAMDGANNSTTFTDSSQNALAATRFGTPVISTTQSKFGGSSAYFNGTSDYITYSSATLFDFSGDFTVEGWWYFLQVNQVQGYSIMHCTIELDKCQLATVGGAIQFYWNGSLLINYAYTVANLLNTWTHVAITRSGSTITMWLNGVNVASATSSASIDVSGLSLGKQLNNGIYNGYFNGYIDDFRVTKAARYTASFTPPVAPFSLPGRLTDLTTNKYNSTMVNGLTFDSSNSGSIVANTTNKYFTGSINSSVWTSNISMCAWFKHTGYGNLWESIFSANTSASFYGSPIMTFNGTSTGTRDQIGINNAGVSASGIFLDLTANHLNKWIYCVITISGTTVTIYAFQDGILSSNSGTLPYTLTRTSTSYYIFRHYSGETTQIFQGNIAKIELYNKALTVSEVIQNYNATKGRFR